MENINEIIGETIPYGPIEMAGGLKAPAASNTDSDFNWGKFGLILLVIVGGSALLYYVVRAEKKETPPKEDNQPPVPYA